MGKLFQKPLVLSAGIVVLITLIPGCQEENISDTKSSVPRTMLLATRNRELKKEINGLKKQHKNEINAWEKRLAKCQRDRQALAKLSAKDFRKDLDALRNTAKETAKLVDESLKSQVEELQKENEDLKRVIAQLKKQLKELRKRPTIRPQPL